VHLWTERGGDDDGTRSPPGSPRSAATCGVCEEAVATRRCLQCEGVLCDDCAVSTHAKGFFKTHTIVPLDAALETGLASPAAAGEEEGWRPRMMCAEHPEEKLNFYCLDCRTVVCSHCLILGRHKGHQQTQVTAAFETGKDTLRAWVEKLVERIGSTEDLLERLRTCDMDVRQGGENQRAAVNAEMDHLRDIIETKRQQLLSKSTLEEKSKRMQLQAQVDRTDAAREDGRELVHRSEQLLALPSEHAFLAVVLPLIQDMKKCQGQVIDSSPSVTANFRPLATDAQVRSLGELDLGYPRATVSAVAPQGPPVGQPPQVFQSMPQAMQGVPPTGMMLQHSQHGAYGAAPAQTVSYISQQAVPVQQVQYVYRSMPP